MPHSRALGNLTSQSARCRYIALLTVFHPNYSSVQWSSIRRNRNEFRRKMQAYYPTGIISYKFSLKVFLHGWHITSMNVAFGQARAKNQNIVGIKVHKRSCSDEWEERHRYQHECRNPKSLLGWLLDSCGEKCFVMGIAF